MNYLKNLAKTLLFSTLIFLTLIIIYTLLIYTNKLPSNIKSINTITLILGILSFFILGFISGNLNQKNVIIQGLISSLLIILISIIGRLITKDELSIKIFLRYLILILSSSFGGMIGVNTKRK